MDARIARRDKMLILPYELLKFLRKIDYSTTQISLSSQRRTYEKA